MRTWGPLALALLGSSALAADDDPAAAILETARYYVPADDKERTAPVYPSAELARGSEGWVHVTYCIDEEGKPQNVSVAESAGSFRFERAAVQAVRRWAFEPATVKGEPVWQSGNDSYISFAIETSRPGGSRRFAGQFRKLVKMLDDGRLAEADELFWSLLDNGTRNLYEISKLWAQRVRYEALVDDFYKADYALRRASANNGEWIEEDSYEELLALQVQVSIKLARYAEAIDAFEDLRQEAGEDSASVQELRPMIDRVRAAVSGDDVLRTPAEIRQKGGCYGCDDSFMFKLARRDFTLAGVDGQLSSITMRCNRKHFESAIAEDVEWHIPESWGSCWVHIHGEPGTTFDILSLPEPAT